MGNPLVDNLQGIADAFAEGLRPPPSRTVSEWADEVRVLAGEAASEPGKWRTSRTPYLREPMDRFSSSDPCTQVVMIFGSQTGKSESLNNWLGACVEDDPASFMVVQPTDDLAREYSKMRIDPLIEATPSLQALVVEDKRAAGGNTIGLKRFPGGFIRFVGANNPRRLQSVPVRYIAFDEIDGYPRLAGTKGSPVALAKNRSTTFKGRKKFGLTSTPSNKGSSLIEAEYLATDQRRYFVACPHCGERQVLRWSGVTWHESPRDAWYTCEGSGCVIEHHEKYAMLDDGVWLPSVEVVDDDGWSRWMQNPEIDPEASREAHGYHLSSLYSPWISWGELADEFLDARGDAAKLQVFTNNRLAETWEDGADDAIDVRALLARCEPEDWTDLCPVGVGVITCAVDVQGDRLEAEFVGWGVESESWQLDYIVLRGDPSVPRLWQELAEATLDRAWRHPLLGTSERLHVQAMTVDSGGHHAAAVLEFAYLHRGRNVWAIRGASSIQGKRRPAWPTKPGKGKKNRDVYTLNVDTLKDRLHAHLQRTAPGAGYCHFSTACDEAYFKQLTAERRVTKYRRGEAFHVWTKPEHRRNEALDVRVYNYAALLGWRKRGFRVQRAIDALRQRREARRAPAAPAEAAADRGDWFGTGRGGRRDIW